MLEKLDDRIDIEEQDEPEPIEAYCVRCREMVTLEDPVPVRTRKGAPATRGDCPYCGGVVYRLGKTAAHQDTIRRKREKTPKGERRAMTLPKTAIYLNYAPADEHIAAQVADDLEKMGCAPLLHQSAGDDDPHEASRMIVLLSPAALDEDTVEEAWKLFRQQNKPVIVATVAPAAMPDLLRRRPRFDLAGDYKTAFRQMLLALHE